MRIFWGIGSAAWKPLRSGLRHVHSTAGMAAVALLLSTHVTPAHAATVDVSIDTGHLGPSIGAGFIGLSFEASALPNVARDAIRGDLVALLRSIGPGVLRFGGASVDQSSAFSADGRAPAPWATTILTPATFDGVRRLLDRTGWRAILAVPLGHDNPRAAAQEVAAASRRLRHGLLAVEIGNEPNAYWLTGLRPLSWGYKQYRGEIRAYRRAIAAAAPGVAVAGPDTVTSGGSGPPGAFDGFRWLASFAHDEPGALLTPHLYPLGCPQRAPAVGELVSSSLEGKELRMLGRIAAIARANRSPARIGETNEIGCGGAPGVSDTFAAALWALRYSLTAARAGIAGINLHSLLDDCSGYSPICAATPADEAAGRLKVMPEWYALLLLRQLVGERLLRSSVAGPRLGIVTDALARPSQREVDAVIVNTNRTGSSPLTVRLRLAGRFRIGTVLRLTAPSLDASSGVTFGGSAVSQSGSWRAVAELSRVVPNRGLRVSVSASSAMLVRLRR